MGKGIKIKANVYSRFQAFIGQSDRIKKGITDRKLNENNRNNNQQKQKPKSLYKIPNIYKSIRSHDKKKGG